tara:strand:- start:87 stop:248 length:162 start_codon:yes stop_codon:yes gene_type:complete
MPEFLCFYCGTKLTHSGSADWDSDDYDIVDYYSCPNCKAVIEGYRPKLKEDKD